MTNSSEIIGNRTRDFPACSTVPQPGAPSRDPVVVVFVGRNSSKISSSVLKFFFSSASL